MRICWGIQNLNLDFSSTLGKALPLDSETVSKCRKTTERVTNNLHNCNFRNELIDTFTVDNLLSKLNSDLVKIMSCLSPIDGVIFIPVCDGVHFQGYIVNIKEHKIIHIDSLCQNQPKNPTFIQIAKVLFQNSQPTFKSLFSEKKKLMSTAMVYHSWLECLRT